MNVILSEECIKQLKIIEILKNKGNKNYGMLYHQIALCVKAIESVDCIDDIPFELRYHQKNSKQIGHLGKPLEKCLPLLHDTWSEPTTVCIESFAIMWIV